MSLRGLVRLSVGDATAVALLYGTTKDNCFCDCSALSIFCSIQTNYNGLQILEIKMEVFQRREDPDDSRNLDTRTA